MNESPTTTAESSLRLTEEEQRMLNGDDGAASAMAMRVIVGLAESLGATELRTIEAAHVDGCLYNGQVSLDFADRLVELGGQVKVPTTVNVGSVDLLHPGVTRESADTEAGRVLMDRYRALGCTATWTCAPYQLPNRPVFGQHVAWAESNAISFINSVVGARTDRYGDFVDICAAITGRVPNAGLHLDEKRRGTVVFDCTPLQPVLNDSSDWATLGAVIGRRTDQPVVVLTGITQTADEDCLKAFAATAASAGGVALFHIVGVTPEAARVEDVVRPDTQITLVHLSASDWQVARRALSTGSGAVDAVSLGTPHLSITEFGALAELLKHHQGERPVVPVYASTGRFVLRQAEELGYVAICENAGISVVVDTCTYVSTVLDPSARTVMTNSGKWAWYAPSNLGVDVVFANLRECIDAAFPTRTVEAA